RARQALTADDRAQVERDLEKWLATDEGANASQTDIENKRYELGQELVVKNAERKRKETAQNIEVFGPDGKSIYKGAAEPPSAGWIDSSTKQPVPQGRTEIQRGSGGAGRQAESQLIAIRGAANEAVASLTNLIEMPITANLGSLMGVQYQTPDSLTEALKR